MAIGPGCGPDYIAWVSQPLDLRVLRYFVAVAEELHFGRAAARLHIAQPSLSVQIRKLEHGIGAKLLERTSRHVELTPAGAVLLEEARRLLVSAERAAAATREAAEGAHGSLVVGFQANAAAELTPKILAAFQARHPRVQVEMRSHDFSDPYVGLSTGSVDVAFIRPPVLMQDWLAVETLFVEPRVLVMASESPLAQHDAPETWRDFWLATDVRESNPVRIGAEVASVDECFEAILSGRGVAFTQASTQRFYDRPGLAFVPVRGLPPSPLASAWRRDMDARPVHDFVETAWTLAASGLVPHSTPAGAESTVPAIRSVG
jgi:DNA-binding transcriptional LysR family regulator